MYLQTLETSSVDTALVNLKTSHLPLSWPIAAVKHQV